MEQNCPLSELIHGNWTIVHVRVQAIWNFKEWPRFRSTGFDLIRYECATNERNTTLMDMYQVLRFLVFHPGKDFLAGKVSFDLRKQVSL